MFKLIATMGYYVTMATVFLCVPLILFAFVDMLFGKKVDKIVKRIVRRHPYIFCTVMILWVFLPFMALIGVLLGMRF